jgi:ribosomal protein L11 methyltransferase
MSFVKAYLLSIISYPLSLIFLSDTQSHASEDLKLNWLELHIDTNHTGLDPVTAMLSALDIDGVVIDDETDFQDFLENNHQYWDYVDEDLEKSMKGKSRVTFYLLANETGFAKMGEVRVALQKLKEERTDCGSLLLSLENIQDADWENSWKQYYKPMEIGDRLLVIPQWEKEETETGSRVPLILDPGLTFGTGSHATTRLCLTALEKEINGGEKVLDLGCGSGILSIAALKLGAATAQAVDIDDKCLTVAYENAALNDIGKDVYRVRIGNILGDEALRAEIGGGYDIVLANIVADVIIGLAPLVHGMMKPGGVFLCSGIIDTRAEEVAEQLRKSGLDIADTRTAEGWYAYTCR